MVNFSDLSKIAGQLDVAGLVKSVKSMVNPDQVAITATDSADATTSNNALDQKLHEMNSALKNLMSAIHTQEAAVNKMNKAMASLSAEIDNLKKQTSDMDKSKIIAHDVNNKQETISITEDVTQDQTK